MRGTSSLIRFTISRIDYKNWRKQQSIFTVEQKHTSSCITEPGMAARPVIKSLVMKGLRQIERQMEGNCCGGLKFLSKCTGTNITGI